MSSDAGKLHQGNLKTCFNETYLCLKLHAYITIKINLINS